LGGGSSRRERKELSFGSTFLLGLLLEEGVELRYYEVERYTREARELVRRKKAISRGLVV